MKFKIVLRYPAGYRYRKEVECESEQDANKIAVEMACEKDKHFVLPHHPELVGRVVKVESVTEIKPLTWNDAINAMSVEEKARFWVGKGTEIHNQACHYAYASETKKKSWDECYVEKMTEFFNSPYDGGKQEGAE